MAVDLPPPMSERESAFLIRIRKESKKRVEGVLNGMYRAFGKMDRAELEALVDGAQDAWMNWTPPE